jgi:CheY-like chemotaxis protein
MTAVFERADAAVRRQDLPVSRRRSEFDVTSAQLAAIDEFNKLYRLARQDAVAPKMTREGRLDADRRLDIVRREHEALVVRAQAQLSDCVAHRERVMTRRAVVAHRHAWFTEKVTTALEAEGFTVVNAGGNGADAVGTAAADQPDVVLLEDKLAMLPGEDVVRQLRTLCPGTLIAVQTEHGGLLGGFLDGGASTAFTRQVPPAEIVATLLQLIASA